jgi:hypothetical protein
MNTNKVYFRCSPVPPHVYDGHENYDTDEVKTSYYFIIQTKHRLPVYRCHVQELKCTKQTNNEMV